MAYFNTAAIVRDDLNQVIEEGRNAADMFIGMKVFPAFASQTIAGTYQRLPLKENKKLSIVPAGSLKRAEKAPFKKIDSSWVTDSFLCEEYGLEEEIGDATQAYLLPSFDAEKRAAQRVADMLQRDHESRCAAALMNTSNFGSALSPTVNYTYTLIATVDFVRDMKRMKRALRLRGENPNAIVMSYDLWDLIQQSTLTRQYLFGVNAGNASVTVEEVAKKLEIDTILVGGGPYTSAGDFADVTDSNLAFMWPTTYIWMGELKSGDFEAGGAGRTIHWTKMAPTIFVNETYRKEEITADVVRVREFDVIKIVNPNAGVLLTTNFSLS